MWRTMLAAVLAAATLLWAVSSVSAFPGDKITIRGAGMNTANGLLTLSSPLVTASCSVSVHFSLSSGPITQTSSIDSIGSITSATVHSCSVGRAAFLVGFPFPGIAFVLPLPWSGMNLRLFGFGISVTLGTVTCLYGGTVGTVAGDVLLDEAWNEISFTNAPVARVSGSILCGSAARLNGSLNLDFPVDHSLA